MIKEIALKQGVYATSCHVFAIPARGCTSTALSEGEKNAFYEAGRSTALERAEH